MPYDEDDAQHRRWWQAYRAINQQFAEAVIGLLEADSRIWVHDYQLLLLPELLKAENIAASVGFFLHIPFPSPKVFLDLPEGRKLLRGMLGADLIGFHTQSYVDNFLESCRGLKGAQVEKGYVRLDGATARVGCFPMGIDYGKFAAANEARSVRSAARRY